jgi:putative phosphoribosyl transferase
VHEPPPAPPEHPFPDRRTAGLALAARLERLRYDDPVILALEPGGVPVGAVAAEVLGAPFGVIAVARIGEPGQRVGAVAEGGPPIIEHNLVRAYRLDAMALATARDEAELAVADRAARRTTPLPDLTGRTAVLVGDGIATGRAAAAAGYAARRRGAARVVAAAPVATADAIAWLGELLDEVICVRCAPLAASLLQWYDQPLLASDDDAAVPLPGGDQAHDEAGVLSIPEAARAVAVLVPPVDLTVAEALAGAGFATLRLSDADALPVATGRLRERPQARGLAVGFVGLGPAAEAALAAGEHADALVVAGGHHEPDRDALMAITAPTLLIAAGEDHIEQRWVRDARAVLRRCETQTVVVPGATHGFPEPRALERVAHATQRWFSTHLT